MAGLADDECKRFLLCCHTFLYPTIFLFNVCVSNWILAFTVFVTHYTVHYITLHYNYANYMYI